MNADLLAKILKSSTPNEAGCWIWTATTTPQGYGLVWVESLGRCRGAHRMSYLASGRTIPTGFQIDHLCRVRCCVNPDHLEAVPPVVNTLRGKGTSAVNARKTHCVNGHEFSPENTIHEETPNGRGRRRCRTCHVANCARGHQARKARRASARFAQNEEAAA